MSEPRVSSHLVEIPVFVYGTLLRGEANHERIAGCRFAGPARTAPLFTLFDLGAYPAMTTGGTTSVAGEVYLASVAHLEVLDRFEGHPTLYTRSRVRLVDAWGAPDGGGPTGSHDWAEAYLAPPSRAIGGILIASGDWRRRHGRVSA